MRGYKIFNPDWTCRDKQYYCPGTFTQDGKLEICHNGIHFCQDLIACFDYYPYDKKNHVAEVIALGEVITNRNISCTNNLKIVREIPWEEVLEIANLGKDNDGYRNVGNGNAGNLNIGHYNKGSYNIGHQNYGSGNSGSFNTGFSNSGYSNYGSYNTNRNNSGDHNSGCYNNGAGNTGDNNVGMANAGSFNRGNYNTGYWNNTSYSAGCFCTEEPKLMLFNKLSNWTMADWERSEANLILAKFVCPTRWIPFRDMTEEEKSLHPRAEAQAGYLKTFKEPDSSRNQEYWDELSDEDKQIVLSIPNFDRVIFKEIMGVDVWK
jgi:hypothetical protein